MIAEMTFDITLILSLVKFLGLCLWRERESELGEVGGR